MSLESPNRDRPDEDPKGSRDRASDKVVNKVVATVLESKGPFCSDVTALVQVIEGRGFKIDPRAHYAGVRDDQIEGKIEKGSIIDVCMHANELEAYVQSVEERISWDVASLLSDRRELERLDKHLKTSRDRLSSLLKRIDSRLIRSDVVELSDTGLYRDDNRFGTRYLNFMLRIGDGLSSLIWARGGAKPY